MLDPKIEKKINALCVKLTFVFIDFYILKNGYIFSMDKEKPFLVQVTDEEISWFTELIGDFKILHITNIKTFKKDMTQDISIVNGKSESKRVINFLKERLDTIDKSTKWNSFLLSNNEEENENLLQTLFKDNSFVSFKPESDDNAPEIILTKSLIPLTTEKNYTKLHYSIQKINDSLFIIIFDLDFDMFRLFMFHHYVPIKEEEKK